MIATVQLFNTPLSFDNVRSPLWAVAWVVVGILGAVVLFLTYWGIFRRSASRTFSRPKRSVCSGRRHWASRRTLCSSSAARQVVCPKRCTNGIMTASWQCRSSRRSCDP